MIEFKLKENNGIDIINDILTNRGLTLEEAQELMNPSIEEHNPFLMKNMDKGIDLLNEVINKGMRIGIVNDVDCDGLGASSILHDFIVRKIGYDNVTVLFHKNPKSHGFDTDIAKKIKKEKVELIILPDAGSSQQDYDLAQEVLKSGVKILIIDHHIPEYNSEKIIMVNPKQRDCEYPNKDLSGCAVTYKYIHAYASKYGIKLIENEYCDVATLTLISDMMNMRNLENRLIFAKGSKKSNIHNKLINAFIENKKIEGDSLDFQDYAFTIASLINATIRVGTQAEKQMLFESMFEDKLVPSKKRGAKGELETVQNEIIRIMTNNKSSKQDKVVKLAVEEIKTKLQNENLMNDKVVILEVGDIIDSSLTGLVANKIMNDVVHRPLMLFREKKEDNSVVGGSARGIGIESIKDICLDTGLFDYVSGHKNACGFQIKRENIDKVREILNEKLKDETFESIVEVDGIYERTVPLQHVKAIGNLQSLFCNEIKEPLFVVKNVKLHTSQIEKFGNATYSFKLGNVNFTKNFGSKVWYENIIQSEILPFGGNIVADLIVKFRKNKQGYYYCEIVDMETREDEDIIDF